jgi:alpha-L-fucosidase
MTTKRWPAVILMLLVGAWLIAAEATRPGAAAVQKWQARKLGMFIHFGMFSALGGVWKGEPVKRGYSEQIRRFIPATREEYAALAGDFNPAKWDPDAVVRLAKDAGMKFIVITAKHHDGFNMFHTAQSRFNVVDATPYGKDIVKGLAEACRRGGLGFGVYYSTIDWHDPRATPPSTPPTRENDNLIPKSHEDFNVAQLQELTTKYGPLSEIWFDMGQPTAEQSRRFADTVHRNQPDCMVGGRVFNSQGDFTVMGDNQVPTAIIDEPWQTPASIYPETWGYRSWQARGDLPGKTREHILNLVHVVSRGGNYLLNIGPRGDGTVVEFEADVLRGVGSWTRQNAEAIYDTEPQPFRRLEFGAATVKPGRLFLMVTEWPADGRLKLPGLKNRLTRAYFLTDPKKTALPLDNTSSERSVTAQASHGGIDTPPVAVVVAEYEGTLNVTPPSIAADASGVFQLDARAATNFYNYNGRGYYERPSIYQQRWDVGPVPSGAYRVEVTYRQNESAAALSVRVAGRELAATLIEGRGEQPATTRVGTVTVSAAETIPIVLAPKRPFSKGEKLGVTIERVVLTPVQ